MGLAALAFVFTRLRGVAVALLDNLNTADVVMGVKNGLSMSSNAWRLQNTQGFNNGQQR